MPVFIFMGEHWDSVLGPRAFGCLAQEVLLQLEI